MGGKWKEAHSFPGESFGFASVVQTFQQLCITYEFDTDIFFLLHAYIFCYLPSCLILLFIRSGKAARKDEITYMIMIFFVSPHKMTQSVITTAKCLDTCGADIRKVSTILLNCRSPPLLKLWKVGKQNKLF